jgi:ACS family hexuronate transporter-like MFS transporter
VAPWSKQTTSTVIAAAGSARIITTLSYPWAVHRGRWMVAGLLFLVTVINYVDRQVFSILAPDLQDEIGWSELDYGRIVIAFQVSYALMTLGAGRLLDRIGTRLGFALAVAVWSLVAMGHALARSPLGFGVARFLLGVGEAANFPAAVKTVAERFPASERAMATGIFNSGVAAGTIVASIAVPLITAAWGWRAAFISTGAVGLLWLPLWWRLYRDGTPPARTSSPPPLVPWRAVVGFRQTWAYTLAKCLADPIWWFYLFWLPKFLAAEHGVRGTAVIPYLMTVYIAADVGCLLGGYLSSALVRGGWSLNGARKATFAVLMIVTAPLVVTAGFTRDPWTAIGLIALACGCHQAWSTMIYTLASDLFPSQAVGSVTGIGGLTAGLVSTVTAELTGRMLNNDASYYLPIFVIAGLLYPIGLAVIHALSPRLTPVTPEQLQGRGLTVAHTPVPEVG